MLSQSHQSPTLQIVGTHGKITTTVEALPLAGRSINRTYTTENGLSIGEIRYVVITNDAAVKNPWLCSGFKVRVGHGNPFVELLPQGRIKSEWWLEGAQGAEPPYYGLPKKNNWLLTTAGMNKKKARRKFHHADVGGFRVEPFPMHKEMLKGPQCGHSTYGDFEFGIRDTTAGAAGATRIREEEPFHTFSAAEQQKIAMQKVKEHMVAKGGDTCNSFSLCQGYNSFWDHQTRKWFDISNCRNSGINTLQECAQMAENSGNCQMDYIQWSNGTRDVGKYCFCNPKGKMLTRENRRTFFNLKNGADVLYPVAQGQTNAEKRADERKQKAEPRYSFNKKLSGQTPKCPELTCVIADYTTVLNKCGNTEACDGFTFKTGGKQDGNKHTSCLFKRCLGYSHPLLKGAVSGADDYYAREGFSISDEKSEKVRAKELKIKYIANKKASEKSSKSAGLAKKQATKKRMVRDKAWEIKEKWTRPYWDVPNGYGNCTAVTNTSKDRCAFYPEEHCTLPGSVRIDAKENCNWEGSFVIFGCNMLCQRTIDKMPKGWAGPAAVKKSEANHQNDLFGGKQSRDDLSPWGKDAESAAVTAGTRKDDWHQPGPHLKKPLAELFN